MINTKAKEIVKQAEANGYGHQKIAQICNVSVGTVSRWKKTSKARSKVIGLLEAELASQVEANRKYLDEATLEDLAARARQLGFRSTFTDIQE